ncbi:SAG family member [Eimeria necatrix]|uniref:SAG family member n=1 Tax=Eimeria necatrix TaxID=51315 RepID=U6N0A4_9EIME|nr:SAG family member [Eimeria necatrix]CDJ69632.1 SAG family member [Eimeria necatrix]
MSVFCGHKTPRAIASVTGAAETVDCLPAMNEARTAAGLAAFEKATDELQSLPQSSPPGRNITAETLWNEICEEMAGTQSDRTEAEKLKGTFAYYEGENDCKAAVQYWKDGFSLFNNEIPPKYQAPNNPKVYDNRAASFVALYNPKENPVASCAFVTCTTAESVAAPSMSKRHSGRASRRLQEKPTTAVVCLTNPAALTANAAPFKHRLACIEPKTHGQPSISVAFSIWHMLRCS